MLSSSPGAIAALALLSARFDTPKIDVAGCVAGVKRVIDQASFAAPALPRTRNPPVPSGDTRLRSPKFGAPGATAIRVQYWISPSDKRITAKVPGPFCNVPSVGV